MTHKIKIIGIILVTITIVCIAISFQYSREIKKLKQASTNSSSVISPDEVKKTVEEVGKYIVLPENETPTMATVSDPSLLKDQPFFANAEAGDVVLIYSTSRKAILWRPSTKKIIDVSPINLPPQSNGTSPIIQTPRIESSSSTNASSTLTQ